MGHAPVIPILILAAGSSTRMRGADKLMEDVGGEPLIRLQVKRATASGHPVFVALPHLDHPRAAAISDLDASLLIVPEAAEGMSGTMRGAVAQLPGATFMMILGDLVDLQTSDIDAILDAHHQHPNHLIWRGATMDGQPGHPIIFDGSLRPEFNKLHGDGGGETLVKPLRHKTHLTKLPGHRARLDLDTPEDWAAWRKNNPRTGG